MTESGMLDIGKHCQYCRQLDFLPFTCEDCGGIFCKDHRMSINHNCTQLRDTKELKKPVFATSNDKPTRSVKEIFNEAKEPKSYELDKLKPKKTVFNKFNNDELTLEKVRKFVFHEGKYLIKKKSFFKNNSSNNFMNFFKSSPSERIVQLSKLKSSAKGDVKIPIQERIYTWVIIVPDSSNFEEFFNSSKKELSDLKKPFYMSRSWPVGRSLDSITKTYNVKNLNNKQITKSEKLSLFRLSRPEELKVMKDSNDLVKSVALNGRVNKEFKDGDVLYLVRGA